MANQNQNELRSVRILCPKLILSSKTQTSLQWLIGSPFFPPLTVVSTVNSIHSDIPLESEALLSLIPRGFEVIGALVIASADEEKNAAKAIGECIFLRNLLYGEREFGGREVIAAVADSDSGEARFYASKSANSESLERISLVVFEDHPQKYVWERGCLLRSEVPIKLPIYYPIHKSSEQTSCDTVKLELLKILDAEKMFERGTEAVVSKLKDPKSVYFLETVQRISTELSKPRVLRGVDLDFCTGLSYTHISKESSQESDADSVLCADFCLNDKSGSPIYSVENADKIQVSVLLNTALKSSKAMAPVAEYFPALEETRLLTIEFKLEVLAYAAKDLPLKLAVSKLVVPGLIDQLSITKNALLPNLLGKHPELRTYHFSPPGYIHPINVTYELNYGETELKQVEVRKLLHSRLGLPFDRPLLRTANALNLGPIDERRNTQKGSTFLKDVHIGIPSSGVSGGMVSLVQGSYEYYHYMHNAFNDSGWGCAYRSLQTIISWFRLQHYTSIEIPSHRDIQETLVQIGDREPSFIGSQGWIGAIELSFVLDQLLGVSCKVINVRSGAELPEKCRELALHFETQGTPVMIGGGVLAYTLLGVDYNDASGDCAFLILDPHYTGNDEHKKIVNGGWCGWKKAVDAKGKHFFLHDKFYNLLLPQRPDMV